MSYALNTFSTNPWDSDIALVQTYGGVQLVGITPPEEGFSSWQEQHFPGETDPAIIGPDADADGDGIRNLLEYGLGGDPNEAGRDPLPLTGFATFTVEGVPGDYLTLTFTRPDGIRDLSYDVSVSSDLATWAATAVLEETIANGDGTTTYIYRDVEPLGSAERRFMVLEVAVPN